MRDETFLERIYPSVYPSFWPIWLAVALSIFSALALSLENYVLGITCILIIVLSVVLFVSAIDKFVYSSKKLILAKNNGNLELMKKILQRKEHVALVLDKEREFQIEIPLSASQNGLMAIIRCKTWLQPKLNWLDFLELEEIFEVWQKGKENEYLPLIEKFAIQPIKEAIEKSGMSSLLVKGFIEQRINESDLKEGLSRQLSEIKHSKNFIFLPKIEEGVLIK